MSEKKTLYRTVWIWAGEPGTSFYSSWMEEEPETPAEGYIEKLTGEVEIIK